PPAFVLSQDQTLQHMPRALGPTAGAARGPCSEVCLDLARTYANLTKPGTHPWLDVSRSSAFKEPPPPHSAGGNAHDIANAALCQGKIADNVHIADQRPAPRATGCERSTTLERSRHMWRLRSCASSGVAYPPRYLDPSGPST